MKMHAVESSNVTHVGYDGDNLHVSFANGSNYVYRGVPADTFRKLLQAKSVGTFLHVHVKPKFEAAQKWD